MSATNNKKKTGYDLNLDLINKIDTYTSNCSKDIERKQNSDINQGS